MRKSSACIRPSPNPSNTRCRPRDACANNSCHLTVTQTHRHRVTEGPGGAEAAEAAESEVPYERVCVEDERRRPCAAGRRVGDANVKEMKDAGIGGAGGEVGVGRTPGDGGDRVAAG